MSVAIIFENQAFVAAEKPGGWLSVPSRQGSQDERPVLGLILENQLGCRLWPVHRLDLEVTGLILFAKTAEAHRAANQWFEHHKVRKTYAALSPLPDNPPFEGDEIIWESRLAKGKKRAFEAAHGKPSRTVAIFRGARVVSGFSAGFWHLEPLTGRSHQLRFEMYKRNLPIIGDRLYGSEIPWQRPQEIALRSFRLKFSECPGRDVFFLPEIIETVELEH